MTVRFSGDSTWPAGDPSPIRLWNSGASIPAIREAYDRAGDVVDALDRADRLASGLANVSDDEITLPDKANPLAFMTILAASVLVVVLIALGVPVAIGLVREHWVGVAQTVFWTATGVAVIALCRFINVTMRGKQ